MNDQLLNNFIKVCEIGSFRKAANDTYMTTSALIKQMNKLEDSLGVKLFIRGKQGTTLTKEGELFYHDAKFIMNYYNNSIQKIREMSNKNDRDIIMRIGYSPLTPIHPFLEYWNKISNKFPNYKLNMIQIGSSLLDADIHFKNFENKIDFILDFYDEKLLEKYHCDAIKIKNMKFKCCIPNNHPLHNKESLKIEDFENQKVILYYAGGNKYFDNIRNSLNENLKNITVIDYNDVQLNIFNLAENLNAILIILEIWKDLYPFMKIVDFKENLTIPYGILYSNHPSKEVLKLMMEIKKCTC